MTDDQALELVVTNPELIYVVDNVLSPDVLHQIQALDWNSRFWINGWNVGTHFDKVIDPGSDQFPFAYDCFNQAVSFLKSLSDDVELVWHIGSYWTIQDPGCYYDVIHRDNFQMIGAWTVLFHFYGDSGSTEFYTDFKSTKPFKTVDFVPGRMVVFPCMYAHRAGQPIEGTTRVCHNHRIQIRSKINDKILVLTPELKDVYNLNSIPFK